MHRLYLAFLRGITANWVARAGAALTTSSFFLFFAFEATQLFGGGLNPYFDLLMFMTLPALFVAGLGLVALGWWLFRRQMLKRGLTEEELLRQQFGDDIATPRRWGSKLLAMVGGLTAVNLLIVGGSSFQMKEHMDSAEFCGTTCHVMNPEWTAYQDSPHRDVPCVECHVGRGPDALLASKLRGLGQMYEHALEIYRRPIPTPVRTLSPADETCGRCHSREHELGRVTQVHTRFGLDAANTRTFSTVSLPVGAGDGRRGVIHWHASRRVEIDFASLDDQRRDVLWVTAADESGRIRRYEDRRLAGRAAGTESVRRMDCTDCHNRVAHVYQDPEDSIDALLESGVLDPTLPSVKAKALAALTASYPDREAARARIRAALERFYAAEHPRLAGSKGEAIERAVVALQVLHARNIHPEMNVKWGDYPSHLGHRGPSAGCFRCHQRDMVDAEGRTPGTDCSLCHTVLADQSPTPFALAAPFVASPGDPLALRDRYLAAEAARTFGAPAPHFPAVPSAAPPTASAAPATSAAPGLAVPGPTAPAAAP